MDASTTMTIASLNQENTASNSDPDSSKSYFLQAKRSVGDNGREAYPLPPWHNPEKIRQGQKFVKDHFFSVFFAHFISLIFLLCYGPVRAILLRTGKSDTKLKSLKRYLSTLVHIKKWYELDILNETGEGAQDVKMVREIHAKVVKCIWKTDQIKSKIKNQDEMRESLEQEKVVAVVKREQKQKSLLTPTPSSPSPSPSPFNNVPSHCCRRSGGEVKSSSSKVDEDLNNDKIAPAKEKGNELNHENCENENDSSSNSRSGSGNSGNNLIITAANLPSSDKSPPNPTANLILAVRHDFTNVKSRIQSSSSTMSGPASDKNNSDNFNHNNSNFRRRRLKRKEKIPSASAEAEVENQTESENYVITQLDMMVTQFCFMGFITMYPRQFGLMTSRNTSTKTSAGAGIGGRRRRQTQEGEGDLAEDDVTEGDEGLEGFIHLWALIGHLLGIDDKFNLCLQRNRHQTPSVLNDLLLPELTNCDLSTVTLWSSLINGIASIIPFVALPPILVFVRQLFVSKREIEEDGDSDRQCRRRESTENGDDSSNNNSDLKRFTLFSTFSNYDRICYSLMNKCFDSWLQYDGCRFIFNSLLRLAVYLSEMRLLPRRGSSPRTKTKCIFSSAIISSGGGGSSSHRHRGGCPSQNLNFHLVSPVATATTSALPLSYC